MSVLPSPTSPLPQYRVKRKPPPTIDTAEKYPSPDPQDPFAPLWVLRNRTSCALGQNPLVTKDTPSPYSPTPARTHQETLIDKMDTFNINLNSIPAVERRRSNSYLSPTTINTINTTAHRSSSTDSRHSSRMVHAINRRPSQSGITTISGDVLQLPTKPTHPQVNSESRLRSNTISLTDKQRNDAQLLHPQPRAPSAYMRSSGNETESDLPIPAPGHRQRVDVKVELVGVEDRGRTNDAGLTTTFSFNVGVDVKPALLRRVASNGTTSMGSTSLARSIRLDGYMADEEERSVKPNSRQNQKDAVHKLSISAPSSDSFIRGRSKSQQSNDYISSARNPVRSRGYYSSDTDLEESTGGARFKGVWFRRHATTVSSPESADVVNSMPAANTEKLKDRLTSSSLLSVPQFPYHLATSCPPGSIPKSTPSPQLRPAQAPLDEEKLKGGKLKKESNGREMEEMKTNSGNGNKGFTTEVKGMVMAQAPRVRKLKATRTPGPTVVNTSVPATKTAVHFFPSSPGSPSSSGYTTFYTCSTYP